MSVCRVFERPPGRHPLLEESLKQYFGDNTTPAHLKMADVPGEDTTRLICNSNDSGATLGPFPLVAVRNVFVLPGEGEGLLCVPFLTIAEVCLKSTVCENCLHTGHCMPYCCMRAALRSRLPHITHASTAVSCLPVCDPNRRRAPAAAEEVAGSGC